MKAVQLLACAAALFAIAGCNKTQDIAACNPPIKLEQVKPPAGSDWTQVVTATPAGGFLMGNPNAKVKLIEIGALTCPHCRAFDEKGVPALVDTYVKSGQVSWEFRSYLLHGLDVPANLVIRCNGAATFFPLMRAMYKDQISWIERVQRPKTSSGRRRTCRRTASSSNSPSSPASRTGPRCAASRRRRARSA
jgi:hypothetical protein